MMNDRIEAEQRAGEMVAASLPFFELPEGKLPAEEKLSELRG
jgi:hypothetical protein